MARSSFLRDLGLVCLATLCAWFALDRWRMRVQDGKLGSDEPEWIAMSMLHYQQFTRGGPPAGSELPTQPQPSDTVALERYAGDARWRTGVQATTFGYMNPCLPKLAWGALFAARGLTQASPFAFERFWALQPAQRNPAWRAALAAEPLARRSVQALAALSAGLLALVARRSLPGRCGWLAAALAFVSWLASPLVLRTAGVIRTDYFMLPFVLCGLVFALGPGARFEAGPRRGRFLLTCAVLGLLGGLATASKLNGALLLLCTGAWVAGALVSSPPAQRLRHARAAALGLLLCGALSLAVFYALNPRLWSTPIDGVRDILARWSALMADFQNDWGPRTGVEVAHGPWESMQLYAHKTLQRDDALGARLGSPWIAGCAIAIGLLALGFRAWRARGEARVRLHVLLTFIAVFAIGTAAWIPLDWERFYLTGLPAIVLAEAVGLAALAQGVIERGAEAPRAQEHGDGAR